MRIFLAALFSLFAFAAFANEVDHSHDDHDGEEHAETEHKATLGDVTLLHAWAAETEGSEVFVYVEIENEGDAPVTLLGAEAEIAGAVELVGFQSKEGTASYATLPMLRIAAGADMVLAPNAVAFRMTGVTKHLHEGDAFEIHVVFDAGEVAMMAQVEAEGASQHSHAGHNH